MTFAAVVRQIEKTASREPRLVTLEDMHWADPSTLELLERLVDAVQWLSIFMIVTARSEVRPHWAARQHVTVQLLNALNHPTSVALIRHIAGARELPAEVTDRIISRADGMPLFIEELTKTVLTLHDDGRPGGYAPPRESLSVDAVPTSLYSSLMSRLDRISVGKEIAQIGSVIGREFSFEMIQMLSELT